MRKIQAILMALIILGCMMKEEPVKTFTAHQVSEDNIFSYGAIEMSKYGQYESLPTNLTKISRFPINQADHDPIAAADPLSPQCR